MPIRTTGQLNLTVLLTWLKKHEEKPSERA